LRRWLSFASQSEKTPLIFEVASHDEAQETVRNGAECHHQTAGALMDMKVVRTFTRDGQKHKEEALVETKRGDIYITSKRLLVVGDGTSATPHEKILEVEVDWDRKVVIITKDGRQKPIYLSVPDPIYSGRLLEILAEASDL
jgi:hypothetical protein